MASSDLEDLSIADLIESLGGIPPARIRLRPSLGSATEAEVLALLEAPRKRICELVDGVLVEKAMGFRESNAAGVIFSIIRAYAHAHRLGFVSGADGTMSIYPGRVRIPDVSFLSWTRFPDGRIPETPIPALIPDLAVAVLSVSNTVQEMTLKRRDYFQAGVRIVWEVDLRTRTVAVYTSPKRHRILDETQSLKGGTSCRASFCPCATSSPIWMVPPIAELRLTELHLSR